MDLSKLDSGTIRRLLALGLGLAGVVFGRKFELDDTQMAALVTLIGVYITGSNAKEAMLKRAKDAGDVAAGSVTDDNAGQIVRDIAKGGQ